jgi:sugar lactone lactonase YvrE
MKRRLTLVLMGALLLALLTVGAAAAAPARTCTFTPSLVTALPWGDGGSFAESMAADSHGRLYVSLTKWADSNAGEIWRVLPNGNKTLVATMDISPYGMLTGVAVDRCDNVYVMNWDSASAYGEQPALGSGVWRVGLGHSLTKVVELPDGTFPNGLAFHGGFAYVTDSTAGIVWRARIGGNAAVPAAKWAWDPLLAPVDPENSLGANGIAFRGDTLFVSVSDSGRIVRIPVRCDGSPGTARVICERSGLVSADGIACDAFGGIWIAVNAGTTGATPSGALYRLSDGGSLQKIADDPGWLNYPVMPVFGTTPATAGTLFVLNGAFDGYEDGTSPDIQALRVGIPGLPLR